MKTLSQCIVDHGTEAVREYRTMSGGQPENEMPEIFLGGCIARGIHRDLGYQTMVGRFYTEIAKEFGVASGKELTNAKGGLRANVAVFQQRRPIAIGLPFFLAAMISENRNVRSGKSAPTARAVANTRTHGG